MEVGLDWLYLESCVSSVASVLRSVGARASVPRGYSDEAQEEAPATLSTVIPLLYYFVHVRYSEVVSRFHLFFYDPIPICSLFLVSSHKAASSYLIRNKIVLRQPCQQSNCFARVFAWILSGYWSNIVAKHYLANVEVRSHCACKLFQTLIIRSIILLWV